MAAIGNIATNSLLIGTQAVMPLTALTNDAAVSTDGSLSPAGIQLPQGIAKWCDRRSGIPEAYPALTFTLRPPTRTSRVFRIFAKFVYPVLESNLGPSAAGITPGPTRAYELTANIEFLIPDRSTAADRQVFYSYVIAALVRNLKASDLSPATDTLSPIPPAVLDLESVY
jgi:hypothetical protein